MELTKVQQAIADECEAVKSLLIAKNRSYGNSALEPINVFFKGSAIDAIHVRIDDKLNRLQKGTEYGQDDTVMDLIGYLILLRVAEKLQKETTCPKS